MGISTLLSVGTVREVHRVIKDKWVVKNDEYLPHLPGTQGRE